MAKAERINITITKARAKKLALEKMGFLDEGSRNEAPNFRIALRMQDDQRGSDSMAPNWSPAVCPV
jgi:hypothetical protein